jgi:hypothetical protein
MDRTAEPPTVDEDRFVLWPLLSVVGALFLWGLLAAVEQGGKQPLAVPGPYSGFGFYVVIGLIFVTLSTGLICLSLAISLALMKMWRLVVSMAMSPAVIVVAVLYPPVFPFFFRLGNYAYHLATWKANYAYHLATWKAL